ncbi:MobA/MobL family protein [Flexibacterium corallicola]|uniref:MobA/MobL family protein n=1 Tax=Flexibacterium corallicola TaxID=3037259 RepID=UPI00286ED694|nr:MobA/MobL family protein [Pseudovibrio sp. M1P-2-3]
MAIYHLNVKPIQRSSGRSSVAAAAYRAGMRLTDDRTGLTHDYTDKKVDHTELVGWTMSRQELWDSAESAERRKDGTTAREYEIALPQELDHGQKIELARDYAQWLHERHGVAVDVCLHGLDSNNPHGHLLTSTRQTLGNDLGEKVSREWSDTRRKKHGLGGRAADLKEARQVWEQKANKSLEMAGHAQTVDHRSLEAQNEKRAPTVHLGPIASEMERRGIKTDLGNYNREVQQANLALTKEASKAVHDDAEAKSHKEKRRRQRDEELKVARERLQAQLVGDFEPSPELQRDTQALKKLETAIIKDQLWKEQDWQDKLDSHLQTRRPWILGRKAWDEKAERLEQPLKALNARRTQLKESQAQLGEREHDELSAHAEKARASDKAKYMLGVLDRVEARWRSDPTARDKSLEELTQTLQREDQQKADQKRLAEAQASREAEQQARLEAQKQELERLKLLEEQKRLEQSQKPSLSVSPTKSLGR